LAEKVASAPARLKVKPLHRGRRAADIDRRGERRAKIYTTGHVPGAINFPNQNGKTAAGLSAHVMNIDIFYGPDLPSGSGKRASIRAERLSSHGNGVAVSAAMEIPRLTSKREI